MSLLERAGAIDAARPRDASPAPPLSDAASSPGRRDSPAALAKERLLIEVSRADQDAKSKGLRPTADPLASRELLASSRVLGTLQKECIEVRKRVHELIVDLAADDSASFRSSPSASLRSSPSATRLRNAAAAAREQGDGGSSLRVDESLSLNPRSPRDVDRLAEGVADLIDEWTQAALAAVLEAYHGIAAVAERTQPRESGERHKLERERERAERQWGERLAAQRRESERQVALLRAQLVARTASLATLRNAYYVEVIRIKRQLIESGAASTLELSPLFEPRLMVGDATLEEHRLSLERLADLEEQHALLADGLGLHPTARGLPPPPAHHHHHNQPPSPSHRGGGGGGALSLRGMAGVVSMVSSVAASSRERASSSRGDPSVTSRDGSPNYRGDRSKRVTMSPRAKEEGSARTSPPPGHRGGGQGGQQRGTSPPPSPPRSPSRGHHGQQQQQSQSLTQAQATQLAQLQLVQAEAAALELPWLDREGELYHHYMMQVANTRVYEQAEVARLKEQLTQAKRDAEASEARIANLRRQLKARTQQLTSLKAETDQERETAATLGSRSFVLEGDEEIPIGVDCGCQTDEMLWAAATSVGAASSSDDGGAGGGGGGGGGGAPKEGFVAKDKFKKTMNKLQAVMRLGLLPMLSNVEHKLDAMAEGKEGDGSPPGGGARSGGVRSGMAALRRHSTETTPDALAKKLRQAQATLLALASRLNESEVDDWLQQLESTGGTLVDADDPEHKARVAKCADVADLLADVLPPLDASMLDRMTFVLRDNFEPLKRIYRHYCTRGKADARTAFALASDNFGAFLAECRLPAADDAAKLFAQAWQRRRAAAAARGTPAAEEVLNLREFFGALARLAAESAAVAPAGSDGARADEALKAMLNGCVLPRARMDTSDELRVQMAQQGGVGEVLRHNGKTLRCCYRFYSAQDATDTSANAEEDRDKTLNCTEWLQCLRECRVLVDDDAAAPGELSLTQAVETFVLANAEEWNENLHCTDELIGQNVQMTYQEFAEALVAVAVVKVTRDAPLREKLDQFVETMLLPHIPEQVLNAA